MYINYGVIVYLRNNHPLYMTILMGLNIHLMLGFI